MKICYVGGNVPWLLNLMSDMENRGHEIHWITLSKPKRFINGIFVHNDLIINDSGYRKYFNFFSKFLKLKKLLTKLSPDVLHAFNVRNAGWISAFSDFTPFILSPQGGDILVNDRSYEHLPVFNRWLKKSFLDKYLRSRTIRKANVVTFGNVIMLNAVNLWAIPKKTLNHFQGVRFDDVGKNYDTDKIKNNLGLSTEKIVFCPRMFNSNSNIEIVIKSIPIVAKYYTDLKFIFAFHQGVSNYYHEIQELIENLDVKKYCLLLDEVNASEMNNYYSISDAVVSVLTSDGMPATVLECLAMKIPQVLSDIPIYQTVFSDFVSIAKLRDPQSTADLIAKSIDRDQEISKKLEKGYDWVFTHANEMILNDQLEEVYLSEVG